MLFDLAEIALRNILSIFGLVPERAEEVHAPAAAAVEQDAVAEMDYASESQRAEDDLQLQLGLVGVRTGALYNEVGRSDLTSSDIH